jgi:hypothetical protein
MKYQSYSKCNLNFLKMSLATGHLQTHETFVISLTLKGEGGTDQGEMQSSSVSHTAHLHYPAWFPSPQQSVKPILIYLFFR